MVVAVRKKYTVLLVLIDFKGFAMFVSKRSMFSMLLLLAIIVNVNLEKDPDTVLECRRRIFNHTIVKKDDVGRRCWDTIATVSCFGRCDSHEVPDWKFPYRKSFHPVCLHDIRERVKMVLKNCDDGVQPGTEIFEYHEAASCKCSVCKTSDASCESIRQKETNFYSLLMKK